MCKNSMFALLLMKVILFTIDYPDSSMNYAVNLTVDMNEKNPLGNLNHYKTKVQRPRFIVPRFKLRQK